MVDVAAELERLRMRTSKKWRGYSPDVIPAFVAEMDFEIAPPIAAVLHEAIDRGDLGYPFDAGMGFAESVAKWQQRAFGWSLDPANVLSIPDVVRGLELCVEALVPPDGSVVLTPPLYPPFRKVSNAGKRRGIEVPLRAYDGRWWMDLDGIECAFKDGASAIMLCHPHNPTGTVWTDAELTGLADLAHRYGAWVIAVEIHAPLTYTPNRHRPFAMRSSVANAHVVTLTSTSKAWNHAGLRAAAIVTTNVATREAIDALGDRARAGAGILGLLAMQSACDQGQPWLDAVLQVLNCHRHTLVREIPVTTGGARITLPEAGYLAWIDFSDCAMAAEAEADAATSVLSTARIALSPGVDFGGPSYAKWARLNFGTSASVLDEILRRLAILRR